VDRLTLVWSGQPVCFLPHRLYHIAYLMPRVTLVSSPMDGSCGIGTYARSLILGFEDEVDVNVVTLETHSNGLRAIYLYVRAAIRAGQTDDDLVHIQHEYGLFGPKWYLLWAFYPLLLFLTRISGTPVVITVHEAWNADRVDPPLKQLKTSYIWLVNRLITLTATSMIFLSANCEKKFKQSVTVQNCHRITHGVDDQIIDVPKAEAKERFGFEPDDTVITEPGYVRPSKGYETFLEIAERMPEYEFLIAGGSRGADEYFESVVESAPDNVTITGHLDEDEFHLAFQASDVVVLPYNEVAQSGIFNMCMTYEIPTVASKLSYFSRIQLEYECLILFENVPDAKRRIGKLLENQLIQEQVLDGLKKYQSQNSFHKICNEHIMIYQSIINTTKSK